MKRFIVPFTTVTVTVVAAYVAWLWFSPVRPVIETLEERTYLVDGLSIEALNDQMVSRGPQGFIGLTDATIRWGLRCQVHLDLIATLPEHRNPDRLDEQLRRSWEDYVRYVRVHEFAHVHNARRTAQAISDGRCLTGFFGRYHMRDWRRSDIVYDERTPHAPLGGRLIH